MQYQFPVLLPKTMYSIHWAFLIQDTTTSTCNTGCVSRPEIEISVPRLVSKQKNSV
jgi:hypothetical protein